ncbi:unnamed protein product [Gulo gulo]|uniref:Uncharacterized protein n=1 Tax=Gulo gulo TaxID=48420 RepID=A0A9X9PT65_GULGU|nr:unnamed protein product [Gulo gulo]
MKASGPARGRSQPGAGGEWRAPEDPWPAAARSPGSRASAPLGSPARPRPLGSLPPCPSPRSCSAAGWRFLVWLRARSGGRGPSPDSSLRGVASISVARNTKAKALWGVSSPTPGPEAFSLKGGISQSLRKPEPTLYPVADVHSHQEAGLCRSD